MSFLSLNQLNVHLGRRHVLHDLTVEVPTGAVGLLGPNGAGKSTLVRTLLGFVAPKRGEARLMGSPVTDGNPIHRERIGYMPEHDCLIPGTSAVAHVAYMGRLAGLPEEDALQRAHEVLWHAGLGEVRYRKVETYSTGMKQRLKLAQAVVHDPDVLFFDEPTNGLDPDGRRDLLELIRDLSREYDKSVLLSSHILPDVEFVCEHVVVLHQGRIVESGALEDLKTFHREVYDVHVKGDAAAFCNSLQARGYRIEVVHEGTATSSWKGRITVRDDCNGTDAILSTAHDTGVQIRNFTRCELSLEDIFNAALTRNGHSDHEPGT